MLRFLWCGGNFKHSSYGALRDGYAMLNCMLLEIERVRALYSGVKQLAVHHRFSSSKASKIYNECRDSWDWMNVDMRREYDKV